MSKEQVKDLEGVREVLRGLMPELQERYGVNYLGIFGSYATGGQRKRSDVDLLVDFDGHVPVSLFKFVALEQELSKAIGHKVDLVEKSVLAQKPAIAKRILEEVRAI